MHRLRNRILVCGVLCASPMAAVHAQAAIESLVVDAAQCTQEKLGARIDPKLIGEPVSAVQFDRVTWHAAAANSAAICVVEGQMLPVDKSATARPIRFAVGLPGSWNRRSIHQGGGGINGTVPQFAPTPGRGGFPGAGPSDTARGFAAYGSDSGHGQENEWTLNDEAIRNFGFEQLKKTHDVAQIIIARLYGEAPKFRYFMGNSQGGREGLTVAQRYPKDYHGIAANVPVVALSGLMQAPAAIRRQELDSDKWVPITKAKAIAAEFMRQCDGRDGLQDGVINDYMGCRTLFNVNDRKGPAEPWRARRCPGNVDPDPKDASERACLTDGQIDTLHFIFSNQPYGTTLAHGTKSFGMWAPSTEVAVGGMPPAMGNSLLTDIRYRGQQGAAADARLFTALGSVGVTGFLLRDLGANPLTYTQDKSLDARQRQLSEWLDSTNPDLRAFQKAGGRLIVAIGTNDTLASPGAQLDYYAALVSKMGQRQLDRFARLYVLPQRGHGLQGNHYALTGDGRSIAADPLPSQFDRLALLQQWVEAGTAPAKHAVVTGRNDSTGLMCSYPAYPHYGGGAAEKAESWRCRN